MSDGITDAEREGREIAEEWKRREITAFLSMRSTKELVEELAKREGVTHHFVNPDQKWYLCIDDIRTNDMRYAGGDTGAARILIVVD